MFDVEWFQDFLQLINGNEWWQYGLRILLFFFIAWVVQRLGHRAAGRLMKFSQLGPRRSRPNPDRQKTLQLLISSMIGGLAYLVAIFLALAQFIDTTTLVWVVGLFSAAFGLGARPLISDFLTGIGFIFEDTFSVGEKVEVIGVEGVIEAVNLRTTLLRAPSGELFVVPNGEIRLVRNFSRGKFSVANISIKVRAEQVEGALAILEGISMEAVEILPNLLEPWRVINESGSVGEHVTLTLLAHARFGKAAEMKPRMLALIHERLADGGIKLVD